MVGPKGCSTQHTTTESLQCWRETVSLLASYLAQDSRLPLRRTRPPGEAPSWKSVCAPKWVSVGSRQANLTARKGHPQRRLPGCEITKQNQKHDTIPPPPGSESLLAEGCLIRSTRSNPGRRSHPHAGESLHLSLHAWARGTVSISLWPGRGAQSAGPGEPLDTVHSLKHPRDPRKRVLLAAASSDASPSLLSSITWRMRCSPLQPGSPLFPGLGALPLWENQQGLSKSAEQEAARNSKRSVSFALSGA